MKTLKLAIVTMVAAANLVTTNIVQAADDIDRVHFLSQTGFLALSEDLGGAIAYRSVSPAEALGITGFDLGVEVTNSKMNNSDEWIAAISTSKELDNVLTPRVHLHKGLPMGFDIAAFYSGSSNSNVDVTGAELRYALVDGGVVKPAIGVRLTYSKLDGIDDLDMSTQSAELAISKGFAFFTPYAAIGKVRITSTPEGLAGTPVLLGGAGLVEEEFTLTRTNVGLNMNFALLNIVLDFDKTGDVDSSTLKFGFRF